MNDLEFTEPLEGQAPRRGLIGPFSARQVLGTVLAVMLVGIGLAIATAPLGRVGAGAPPNPEATPYLIGSSVEGLKVGDRAPDFTVTRNDGTVFRLADVNGRPLSLGDLKGKAVWIDFWASWCPPCQAETPVIRDAAATYRSRGLEVISISVQEASVDDVRTYAQRYGLTQTVAADLSGDIFELYKVYALPTQIFLDADGVIRSIVYGPLTAEGAAAQIEAVLPKAEAP